MRRLPGLLLLGAPLAIALVIGVFASGTEQSSNPPLPPSPALSANAAAGIIPFQSVSSCSAVACHGDVNAGLQGAEQRIYSSDDKHAKAYQVLFDERSKVIAWNLYKRTENWQQAEAQKEELCLRCHGPGGLTSAGDHFQAAGSFGADGVGCESCHGNSERWLTTHFLPSWKTLSPKDKTALGFVYTKDLATRAEKCMECHVGSPDREVNHDLIAAGHPRLRYEFANYHDREVKHWREKSYGTDFEVRTWAIGQVAAAKTAVKLLEARAARADQTPWPELAEYSCYSCHHALKQDSWRLQAADPAGKGGRRTPGVLRWGNWYGALLDPLAELAAPLTASGRPAALDAFKKLHADMQKYQHRAPAEAIRPLAAASAAELDGWLRDLQAGASRDSLTRSLSGRQVLGLLGALASWPRDEADTADWEWEQATQQYLGMDSLRRALGTLEPRALSPAATARLRKLRDEQLRFSPGHDAPLNFTPDSYLRELRGVREALNLSGESR